MKPGEPVRSLFRWQPTMETLIAAVAGFIVLGLV